MVHNRAKASTIVEKYTTKRTNNNNARAITPALKLQLNHATVTQNGGDAQPTSITVAEVPTQPIITTSVRATATTVSDASRSNFQGGFSTKSTSNITRGPAGGVSHSSAGTSGIGNPSSSAFWTGFQLNDAVKSGSTKQLNS